ncbi:MAG: hypothetical protein IPG71_01510 [bacterium]|nr:hypothetical protein [bacterium]
MNKFLTLVVLCVASTAFATIHNVTVSGLSFTPANITIQQGDTVRWTKGGGLHNVAEVTATPVFRSGNPTSSPFVYDFAFNAPLAGTYNYECEVHFSVGMVGTVTVEVPPPPCLDPTDLVIKWEAADQVHVYWQAPQMGHYVVYGTADATLATTPPGPGWSVAAEVDVAAIGQADVVITGLSDQQFFVVVQDCTP